MFLRLGASGRVEACGWSGGASDGGGRGYEFEQVEGDIFIAAGTEARTGECVHRGKVSKGDASRWGVGCGGQGLGSMKSIGWVG